MYHVTPLSLMLMAPASCPSLTRLHVLPLPTWSSLGQWLSWKLKCANRDAEAGVALQSLQGLVELNTMAWQEPALNHMPKEAAQNLK